MNVMQARVARLFPSTRQPRSVRVGLEHELVTADLRTGAAVAIERVRRAAARAAYAPVLGFEPGGQVELSLPCADTPAELDLRLRAQLAALRADCDGAGVALAAVPVDPRGEDEVPLQLTTPRYVAMQAHFDKIGPAGRRMMRRTASTQVCLDWWPGLAGLEQWRLLLLAGPFLAAAFARSAGPESRLATWLVVDPGRTAFDDKLLHGDPIVAYADFAARAGVFTTPGDLAEHLTTLFPPVRPRGRYLEVRFLDVQEGAGIARLLAVLTTLAYDEACRRTALRMLAGERGRLGEHWVAAAAGDPETCARGSELVTLATAAARWAPPGYLPAAAFDSDAFALGGVA